MRRSRGEAVFAAAGTAGAAGAAGAADLWATDLLGAISRFAFGPL